MKTTLKLVTILFSVILIIFFCMNYESVKELFTNSNEVVFNNPTGKECPDGLKELVYNESNANITEMNRVREYLCNATNMGSKMQLDVTSDGIVSLDEGVDLLSEFFFHGEITIDHATYYGENDAAYLFLIQPKSLLHYGAMEYASYWRVNKITGEIQLEEDLNLFD